ncbi:MAG: hydroxymethylglutaryl-CoA lyase [Bacteroidia bacterium]
MIMRIKIIECPRDAMQGLTAFIPTRDKIRYLNSLMQVGFDTLDFGSFVSPKAIPQMADTLEVLQGLDLQTVQTKLLAIVANTRGAATAAQQEAIHYLGFPFSLSETFQRRNTNATMAEALTTVKEMQELCVKNNKELVVYLSMGFGNPYGDPWNAEVVEEWSETMSNMGIGILSLSDTIGIANPDSIAYLYKNLIPKFPHIEFGAHLHTTPDTWEEKVTAAFENGCQRFDGAIKGFGGCPMAADHLTGNMPTENLIGYFNSRNIETGINPDAFNKSMLEAVSVFPA